MKQVWQLIDQAWIPKEYQYKNNQMNKKDRGCTKISERTQNNRIHVIKWGKSIQHINQSINGKYTHVGPHQNPICLAWIGLTNFIISKLWKIHYCLCKIKGNRRLFKKTGIKIVQEKTGFFKFILKFESWELNLGIWIFGN